MLNFNIGIDLLHIARIRSLLLRQGNNPTRFAARILTSNERELFTRKFPLLLSQPPQQQQEIDVDTIARYLAVRWAAKEAAYKASSFTKNNNYEEKVKEEGEEKVEVKPPPPTWKDFEVLYKENGRPYLAVLKDGKFEGKEGKLSISHDGDFVVAVAVLPE